MLSMPLTRISDNGFGHQNAVNSSLAMVKGLVTAIGGNEFPLLQISYWVLWMRVDARCGVRSTLPMPPSTTTLLQ